MHKILRMSADKCESLKFYKYLCQKIGSEEVVRIRRLALCISGLSESSLARNIYSGSKSEGLDLKGSDLDIMVIDTNFKVYESESEVIRDGRTIPLIMNTDETQPCFTQLRLRKHHQISQEVFKNLWEKSHLGNILSSEQYKLFFLSTLNSLPSPYRLGNIWRLHGPCLSDNSELFDFAYCLKCDQWIHQAQPWIYRPRATWPSPESISKIISFGVLFVPIGCKGSINENLEWRISFSVAEKFLIFSFSHTQLLCYALLKILLKEIVEKYTDLKGLLCSYFIKTLMFWISEETDQTLWRPDNIIPCFMACLQRLMYCVRYSILSHYFISDNNLFYSRFNVMNKTKIGKILTNLYKQGINSFSSSETLKDYAKQSYNIAEYLTTENVIKSIRNGVALCDNGNINNILYNCIHYSRTCLSRGLFSLYLSKAYRFDPDASKYGYNSENKQQYFKYKYDRSHLLKGSHSDAVSGWLTLSSFFYVHKEYFAALRVINHALQKYTDETFFSGFTTSELNLRDMEYTFIPNQELNHIKKENLSAVVKAVTVEALIFRPRSLLTPQELQLNTEELKLYDPLRFAYFLSFLCCYHLHDITSCRHYLKLLLTMTNDSIRANPVLSTPIMCGLALKLIGETSLARQLFQVIVDNKPRLSWLSSVV